MMKTLFAVMLAMLLLACLAEPCTAFESKFLTLSEKTLSVDLGPSFEVSKGDFKPGENGTVSQEFLINNTAAPGAAFLSIISVYDDIMRRMSTDALCELFLIGGLSGVEDNGDAEIGNWTAVDFKGKNVMVVDDMIASGESILDVAHKAKELGAAKIYLIATFALFAKGIDIFKEAYERKEFDKIYTTNLTYIPAKYESFSWLEEVDCSLKVAQVIDALNRGTSLSNLVNDTDQIDVFK